MKRQIVPLALSAVVGVVTLALFLAGVFDGGDSADGAADGSEVAALCAEDSPDCEDTIVVGDGTEDDSDGVTIAPVCAPGILDCADTIVGDDEAGEPVEGNEGVSSAPVCAPGFPDCVDTIVSDDETGKRTDGEGVGIAPACASSAPDCADTIVTDDETGRPVEGTDGVSIDPLCAPGVPDCADTIVNDDIDDAEPAVDPIMPVDGECVGEAFSSCRQQAINAALTDAERLFGVDESELVVESAVFQEWSNSCLDAADAGELCAAVITPGFVIVIEFDGTDYEYHTDLNGNVRLAL